MVKTQCGTIYTRCDLQSSQTDVRLGLFRLRTPGMALPTDVALTIASAGVPLDAPGDELERAIRHAIADRRGYFDGPRATGIGFEVELLFPVQESFEGATPELALAWCLIYLMVELGELGIGGFTA